MALIPNTVLIYACSVQQSHALSACGDLAASEPHAEQGDHRSNQRIESGDSSRYLGFW